MKLWFCPNHYTEEQTKQAVSCASALEASGLHTCFLSAADSLALYGNDSRAALRPEDCDLIVSLGGDGAALRAAKTAVSADKPLFGINSGRLGYLCAMSLQQIDQFDAILASCRVSPRGLLTASFEDQTITVVNDLVFAKIRFGETVELTVSVDAQAPFRVRGDGLIISTPTGSTAYSFSAGGPVMEPSMPAVILTPICPHDTMTHANVISNTHRITVSARADKGVLYADGVPVGEMTGPITVESAAVSLRLYVRHESSCSMNGLSVQW